MRENMSIVNTLFLAPYVLYFLLWRISASTSLVECHTEHDREVCVFPNSAAAANHAPAPATTQNYIEPTYKAAILASPLNTDTLISHENSPKDASIQNTVRTICFLKSSIQYCLVPNGAKVEISTVEEISEKSSRENEKSAIEGHMQIKRHSHGHSHGHSHSHVDHSENKSKSSEMECRKHTVSYNVNLRIGLLFVILATSAIGVFTPLFLNAFFKIRTEGIVFTFIKQFGTGIIIATAFIHLLTHGQMMFASPCLADLQYESTATSITLGGLFLAFLVDYLSHRLVQWQRLKARSKLNENQGDVALDSSLKEIESLRSERTFHRKHCGEFIRPIDSSVSLFILEAGIIFHSLLIGITLVVADDSVFITLLIVIIFHQMFEGLALGARIAAANNGGFDNAKSILLPLAFSFTTPLGMAIGIGTLHSFNDNDAATIIVLGTLDSLSAGILIWVGIIDLWAGDWVYGELANAAWPKTVVGMISLVAGFALMGLLGKWA